MGYWDKREAKEAAELVGEENAREVVTNGDAIDTKGLDELEAAMADTQQAVLDTIDDLAAQVKRQKAYMKDITSSNFWFAVCFNNQMQKEQFLAAIGITPTDTFVEGRDFAKRVGVQYKEPDHVYKTRGVQKKYAERAREIGT